MTFCNVFQSHFNAEFFCDSDGIEDIICCVCVCFERHFAFDNRNKCFHLHIKWWAFGIIITSGINFCCIFSCFEQHFAEFCRCRHTCGVALVTINTFWVFTKSAFHSNVIFNHHIVTAAAYCFDGHECAAQHVGRTRTCTYSCNTAFNCLAESRVHSFDTVNATHLWAGDIVHFVILHTFTADAVAIKTNVAVGFNKARVDVHTFCINQVYVFTFRNIFVNFNNFAVAHQNISFEWLWVDSIVNKTVFYKNHNFLLYIHLIIFHKIKNFFSPRHCRGCAKALYRDSGQGVGKIHSLPYILAF